MCTRIKNISLHCYRLPRKTIKFAPVVPKTHGRDNVCALRKSIKSCNFQKWFFGAFYKGWHVVMHPCSNFSLRRQMAPLRSIKFQTADFPIICSLIIVIFWTTCIIAAREVFSVVVMGKWETRTAGIAVLQKRHCFFLIFLVLGLRRHNLFNYN